MIMYVLFVVSKCESTKRYVVHVSLRATSGSNRLYAGFAVLLLFLSCRLVWISAITIKTCQLKWIYQLRSLAQESNRILCAATHLPSVL